MGFRWLTREDSLKALSFLLWMLRTSSAIMCYQCASTGVGGDCIDNIGGLINATKGIEKYRYTNNCTDSKSSWDRCVLEVHRGQKDAITLFLRGCHDGKHFNPAFHDKRFDHLVPDNKTTCAQKDQLVCFTFCDTDFCNGPQPPNETDPCAAYKDDYDYDYDSDTCGGNSPHHPQQQQILLGIVISILIVMMFKALFL